MKSSLYGQCPVCNKNLHLDDKSNIRFCGQCHREYYSIEERNKSDLGLQYDLETVSVRMQAHLVLCSSLTSTTIRDLLMNTRQRMNHT